MREGARLENERRRSSPSSARASSADRRECAPFHDARLSLFASPHTQTRTHTRSHHSDIIDASSTTTTPQPHLYCIQRKLPRPRSHQHQRARQPSLSRPRRPPLAAAPSLTHRTGTPSTRLRARPRLIERAEREEGVGGRRDRTQRRTREATTGGKGAGSMAQAGPLAKYKLVRVRTG